MKKELYVIITAGGIGARMGSDTAKHFLSIDNKPILLKTIELFKEFNNNVNLIIVLPNQYKEYWKNYCLDNNLWFKHIIVSGGITRFHSVKNALKYVPDNSIVAIHDGVRPFVPHKMLKSLIEYKFDKKNKLCGVIPVLPIVESIREKVYNEQGKTIETKTVRRDNYSTVKTPQVFLSTEIKKCYEKPYSPIYTDDASVLENNGYKVATTPGSRFNIKITTPSDLLIADIFSKLESWD